MSKDLERIDVAVKAVWLLYKRDRWPLLEALGIARNRISELFRAFDEKHVFADHGLITSDNQLYALLEMAGPELVDVAVFMLHMFWEMPELERLFG